MATTKELQAQAKKDGKILEVRELFLKRIEEKVEVSSWEVFKGTFRILAGIIRGQVREEKKIKALKPILISEPNCGKECPDHEYPQCQCHTLCVSLFTNFWEEKKEGFTDAEKRTIASKYDRRTGFLDINKGCRLPRKLRPYLCMRVICRFLSGKGLEKYRHYQEKP